MKMEGEGLRVLLAMLVVQAIATGLQLLSKVILGQGTFVFALLTYRHIVAAFCVAPIAFLRERDSWKKLNLRVLIWLFLVALSGISMAMGFFYFGLRDTSATYASNFLNLIPIFTFAFSIIFRFEKLRLNTKDGKIKLIGAILCLWGALTMAVYKGKMFHFSNNINHKKQIVAHVRVNWKRGTIFLVCSGLSYGFWFITQAKLFKIFPHVYSATTIIATMATLQSAVVGLCIDRSKESWRLGWDLQLITIFYSGTLATAVTFCLISWAISKRGPTYPSMFNPLSLILVAITEAVFLGTPVSLGSLIGMSCIIVGLYSFLWGKNMEVRSLVRSNAVKSLAQLMADEAVAMQPTSIVAVVPATASSANDHCTATVVPESSPCDNDNSIIEI